MIRTMGGQSRGDFKASFPGRSDGRRFLIFQLHKIDGKKIGMRWDGISVERSLDGSLLDDLALDFHVIFSRAGLSLRLLPI